MLTTAVYRFVQRKSEVRRLLKNLQADARARKEDAEWKETQREILEEIDEALQKQHQMARDATIEVLTSFNISRHSILSEPLCKVF